MEFNKLIPELMVSDFEKSLDFYTNILHFKIEYTRENFVFLSYQGSQIMIEKANDNWKTDDLEYPLGRGINFEIETDDVVALYRSLKEKECPIFKDLMENWYKKDNMTLGNKEFLVQDPDGYLLRFSQSLGEKEA